MRAEEESSLNLSTATRSALAARKRRIEKRRKNGKDSLLSEKDNNHHSEENDSEGRCNKRPRKISSSDEDVIHSSSSNSVSREDSSPSPSTIATSSSSSPLQEQQHGHDVDVESNKNGQEQQPLVISANLASIRGVKKQARYDPGVPMTKAELREWRKEARRVRNRESAAASRMKTRSRIGELETEVSSMKDKYGAALQRIAELEATLEEIRNNNNNTTTSSPSIISITSTPRQTPVSEVCLLSSLDPITLSPVSSYSDKSSDDEGENRSGRRNSNTSHEETVSNFQHTTNSIGRPNALGVINL